MEFMQRSSTAANIDTFCFSYQMFALDPTLYAELGTNGGIATLSQLFHDKVLAPIVANKTRQQHGGWNAYAKNLPNALRVAITGGLASDPNDVAVAEAVGTGIIEALLVSANTLFSDRSCRLLHTSGTLSSQETVPSLAQEYCDIISFAASCAHLKRTSRALSKRRQSISAAVNNLSSASGNLSTPLRRLHTTGTDMLTRLAMREEREAKLDGNAQNAAETLLPSVKKCYACGLEEDGMKQCSQKCGTFYCSQACQVTDWHEGDHAKICKLKVASLVVNGKGSRSKNKKHDAVSTKPLSQMGTDAIALRLSAMMMQCALQNYLPEDCVLVIYLIRETHAWPLLFDDFREQFMHEEQMPAPQIELNNTIMARNRASGGQKLTCAVVGFQDFGQAMIMKSIFCGQFGACGQLMTNPSLSGAMATAGRWNDCVRMDPGVLEATFKEGEDSRKRVCENLKRTGCITADLDR
jgi:hypothetical protein